MTVVLIRHIMMILCFIKCWLKVVSFFSLWLSDMLRRSFRLMSGGYYNSDEESDSSSVTNISYRENPVKYVRLCLCVHVHMFVPVAWSSIPPVSSVFSLLLLGFLRRRWGHARPSPRPPLGPITTVVLPVPHHPSLKASIMVKMIIAWLA